MHTYIAEEQSQLLPALEVLPMINANGNRDQFQYTTLAEFEESYWMIPLESPVNYGWYQFRFHFAAKQVYDQAGEAALKNLWTFLDPEVYIRRMSLHTMKVYGTTSNKDHPHIVYVCCFNKPFDGFNQLLRRKRHNFTFAHGDKYENSDLAPFLWVGKG